MAMKMPKPDETEMNMTPMIDIVFQLIVFFMLTLKFKSVDHRIESTLPKDRGINPTQQDVKDLPLITIKLFRDNPDDAKECQTKIRVGQDVTILLPKGEWTGIGVQEEERLKEYADAMRRVVAAIKDLWAKQDNNPEVKGEIKTPPKTAGGGSAVPHGDVVRILDAFLQAGITDVKFEGAASPLPVSGQ